MGGGWNSGHGASRHHCGWNQFGGANGWDPTGRRAWLALEDVFLLNSPPKRLDGWRHQRNCTSNFWTISRVPSPKRLLAKCICYIILSHLVYVNMTGWQWFHMFDTMSFHHTWSWLIHPLHHRPSWPSWHLVNLTGGSLSVTLSTTSWHKVHHRIEEHQRKMNKPTASSQRLFFPSCWRNPRPRSPATPTKQWTPWMDALISPTRTFWEQTLCGNANIFGGVFTVFTLWILLCYVGKWNFVEKKRGFGKCDLNF